MDAQEIRDKIMSVINGMIKNETETSDANLHDVLAAKMRDRMNPSSDDHVDDDHEKDDHEKDDHGDDDHTDNSDDGDE